MKGSLKIGLIAIFLLSACAPMEDDDTKTGHQSVTNADGTQPEPWIQEEAGSSPEGCQPLLDALATAPPEAHDELIQAFDECIGDPSGNIPPEGPAPEGPPDPALQICDPILQDLGGTPPEDHPGIFQAFEDCVQAVQPNGSPYTCHELLDALEHTPPEIHEDLIQQFEACIGQPNVPSTPCEDILVGLEELPPELLEDLFQQYDMCVTQMDPPEQGDPACEDILADLGELPPELHEDLFQQYDACVTQTNPPEYGDTVCEGILEGLEDLPPEFHEDLFQQYDACVTQVTPEEPPLLCNEGYEGSSHRFGGSELHVVGIYEARSDHGFGYHPEGEVTVRVEPSMQPVVLVLSSYEPVHWKLDVAPGTVIEHVILNGYHDSRVSGHGGVPVEEFTHEGTGSYIQESSVFDFGTPETQAFLGAMEAYTGRALASFQGCYNEDVFTISAL